MEMETTITTDDAVAAQVKELQERIAVLESKDDHLTMVLFSGDFDKAMAAFIIANGAIAMGREVTIFVTFWTAGIRSAASCRPVSVRNCCRASRSA